MRCSCPAACVVHAGEQPSGRRVPHWTRRPGASASVHHSERLTGVRSSVEPGSTRHSRARRSSRGNKAIVTLARPICPTAALADLPAEIRSPTNQVAPFSPLLLSFLSSSHLVQLQIRKTHLVLANHPTLSRPPALLALLHSTGGREADGDGGRGARRAVPGGRGRVGAAQRARVQVRDHGGAAGDHGRVGAAAAVRGAARQRGVAGPAESQAAVRDCRRLPRLGIAALVARLGQAMGQAATGPRRAARAVDDQVPSHVLPRLPRLRRRMVHRPAQHGQLGQDDGRRQRRASRL